MKLKERAARLKRDIPAVFLALRDEETPLLAKILGWITVGYALSPIDLVPDFIPVLGWLDDILLLPALAAWTIALIPKAVMDRCRREAEGLWEKERPKKWRYAIPIILVWACVLVAASKAVLPWV